jgi:hypothetical protein
LVAVVEHDEIDVVNFELKQFENVVLLFDVVVVDDFVELLFVFV